MNCVVLQPSYIPWRGYFHQIRKADVFVFYDDVAYDKHGWRNRNRIKTPSGPAWLTIPVLTRGSLTNLTPIDEMRICWNRDWATKHWKAITQSYRKAPHFGTYSADLEKRYASRPEMLADFTIDLTVLLSKMLGIDGTRFVRSSTLGVSGRKTERLLEVLRAVGATHYISGPSARDYLDEALLASAGITLEYMTYDYPAYDQPYPPFEPSVSVLDLLFAVGPDAPRYIWGS